jgi:hypothetical protein
VYTLAPGTKKERSERQGCKLLLVIGAEKSIFTRRSEKQFGKGLEVYVLKSVFVGPKKESVLQGTITLDKRTCFVKCLQLWTLKERVWQSVYKFGPKKSEFSIGGLQIYA